MKRLLTALMLLLTATAALAFDEKKTRPRVGILRVSDVEKGANDRLKPAVAYAIVRAMQDELRERGVEAFDAGVTWHDRHLLAKDADYYVEICGAETGGTSRGGVGIGTGAVGVTIEKVVSWADTEVRVYDGQTLEPLATERLSKEKKAILPTSVGIGGSRLWAILAMPIAEYAQQRAVMQAVARDAANVVVSTLMGE
jgi:hypothetical protein